MFVWLSNINGSSPEYSHRKPLKQSGRAGLNGRLKDTLNERARVTDRSKIAFQLREVNELTSAYSVLRSYRFNSSEVALELREEGLRFLDLPTSAALYVVCVSHQVGISDNCVKSDLGLGLNHSWHI